MRKLALLILAMLLISSASFAQSTSGTAIPLKGGWAFEVTKLATLMHLEQSKDNTGIIAKPGAGVGPSLTFFYVNSKYSAEPILSLNLDFVLTTRVDDTDALDVLIGGDVGIKNNLFRIGGGYLHNQWIGLFGVGF